jgi:transmembrane sensor
VELNSRSRIRVRYTDDERRIDLIEGQALFQVAKNKHRPFIVDVDNTQVRAVGTQFDVYRKPSGTVVTVVEGRVAVLSATPDVIAPAAKALDVTGEPAIFLAAGEQLTLRQKAVTRPQAVNTTTTTAWTQRQLIFENASLHEVAEEFNRYSARPIVIEGRDFDTFHISGTYSSTSSESLLRFLRIQPGIKVIETDREIRIARE